MVEVQGVVETVKRIGNIERLEPDEVLYESGFTSMSALVLLTELEDVYGVTIRDDQFVQAKTARDLARLLCSAQPLEPIS